MTVDGQEAKDSYVIDEGHKVDVSCAFETGNPPVIVQLLNQHNYVLKSSGNQGHLNYSLSLRCEDEWPIVKCQGSGSAKSRSVTFLVRCKYFSQLLSWRLPHRYSRGVIHVKENYTMRWLLESFCKLRYKARAGFFQWGLDDNDNTLFIIVEVICTRIVKTGKTVIKKSWKETLQMPLLSFVTFLLTCANLKETCH